MYLRQFSIFKSDPVLRLMLVLGITFGIYICTIGPYQSLIAVREFGISEPAYAVILVMALLVSVAAAIGIGIITDQRPSRRLMSVASVGAMIVGAVTVRAGNSAPAFIVAHVLLFPIAGTFFGQIFAVTRLASARYAPGERDGIMTTVRSVFGIPWVLFLPLTGRIIDSGVSMIDLYLVVCGIGLVMLVLVQLYWPADRDAPWVEQKSGLGFRASIAEMTALPILVRVLLIGITNMGGAAAGVLIGLSFDAAGRGSADVGIFFSSFIVIEIATMLLTPRLLVRFSRLQVISAGSIAYGLFLALLSPLAAGPWVWVLIVPAGAGGGMIYSLTIGYLADLLGKRAGAGASLIALQRISSDGLNALLFALGTWVAGYWLVGLLDMAAMAAAVIVLIWLDRNRPFAG